jgi:UDP-MurNAc hydroxylase
VPAEFAGWFGAFGRRANLRRRQRTLDADYFPGPRRPHIETQSGGILCDLWKNPAYFDSWFVFPDDSELGWDRYDRADYLYVSHLHQDHVDPRLLSEHVSRAAAVPLPDFPVPDLRGQLERLGFTRFCPIPNGRIVQRGGLRLIVQALRSPADGPLGDSLLAVGDETARVLNQNEARPVDLS